MNNTSITFLQHILQVHNNLDKAIKEDDTRGDSDWKKQDDRSWTYKDRIYVPCNKTLVATSYRNTMTHRLQDATVTSRLQEISYVTIGGPQFNKMSGSMLKDARLASQPNPIDSLLKNSASPF